MKRPGFECNLVVGLVTPHSGRRRSGPHQTSVVFEREAVEFKHRVHCGQKAVILFTSSDPAFRRPSPLHYRENTIRRLVSALEAVKGTSDEAPLRAAVMDNIWVSGTSQREP